MTAVKLPSDIANCLVNWLLFDDSSAARDGLLMAAPAPDCAFASGPADGMPPRTVVVRSAMADRLLASVSIRVLFRFISSSVSAYTGMQFPFFDKIILCFSNIIIFFFIFQYRKSSRFGAFCVRFLAGKAVAGLLFCRFHGRVVRKCELK